MLKTDSFATDVLVIGSGIAGMLAAIEARKGGAQVAIVSKSALGKESSTSYARTFRNYEENPATVKNIPGYDSKPGKHLEDWPLVRTIYKESARQMENLVTLGVPMVLVPANGAYDTVPSWRPKGSEHTHGGAIVLDALAPITRKMGIRAVESCSIISLLRDEDRVTGASGLLHDGSWLTIYAKAVIMATGGAAGLNKVTSTSKEIAGNGFAMALKAGLRLKNMEFNSFYAVGLPTPTGRYVHCAPVTLMMKNALLRNDNGADIVKKHLKISLQEAVPPISTRFDWLPRAVAAALEEGKVWLDLTHVPDDEWDRLPERNWKQIRQTQVDMKKTPLSILPLSQSFRGGLAVDTGMRTSLKGLYAAGEAASSWLAELGISALPSCLTMGAIAGRNAAA
ncbi:MAG: sdhA, partial [Dehalococcoidia bacterium]|nr:sdhA [Dehalococcoidia bacterium]